MLDFPFKIKFTSSETELYCPKETCYKGRAELYSNLSHSGGIDCDELVTPLDGTSSGVI